MRGTAQKAHGLCSKRTGSAAGSQRHERGTRSSACARAGAPVQARASAVAPVQARARAGTRQSRRASADAYSQDKSEHASCHRYRVGGPGTKHSWQNSV